MRPKSLAGQLPSTPGGDQALRQALANILRNMDEVIVGTWTPTITAGTGTFTSVSAVGAFTRIGDRCFYDVVVTITTVGTAAGAVNFTLPFPNGSRAHVGYGRETVLNGNALTVTIDASASIGAIREYDNTTAAASGATLAVAGNFAT